MAPKLAAAGALAAASLLLSTAARTQDTQDAERRWFWRAGYAYLKLNDSSSDARDITGPVVRPSDNALLALLGIPPIGVPAGVRAEVGDAGSAFVSLGRYFSPYWSVEALVLAVPFEHEVRGAGTLARLGPVATVKQVPPTVIGYYHFRDPSKTFRPALGLGLNYTRFFDARATPALEQYVGGPTSVSLSSSWGPGVFASGLWRFDKRLHVNLTLGYVDVRTTATLTTTNTQLSNTSPVLQDQPAPVPQLASNALTGPIVNGILQNIAQQRGGNLGTYERQIDLKLNPYVFALTVGYSF
jgi:outer membrane protein W